MDVKSEIVMKFSENLSATQSCSPDFIARVCELIKADSGVSKDKVIALIEDESDGQH